MLVFALVCIGLNASAQKTVRPEWFWNNDCIVIKNLINKIRVDSLSGSELNINYSYSEFAKKELGKYLANQSAYKYPSGRFVGMVNGFTEKELMEKLLLNTPLRQDVINAIFKGNYSIGIYVGRIDFHGRELFYLYYIIPFGKSDCYTRTK